MSEVLEDAVECHLETLSVEELSFVVLAQNVLSEKLI